MYAIHVYHENMRRKQIFLHQTSFTYKYNYINVNDVCHKNFCFPLMLILLGGNLIQYNKVNIKI